MLKSKSLCLSGWIVHDLLQHLVSVDKKEFRRLPYQGPMHPHILLKQRRRLDHECGCGNGHGPYVHTFHGHDLHKVKTNSKLFFSPHVAARNLQ
jgi:hypothetical protein